MTARVWLAFAASMLALLPTAAAAEATTKGPEAATRTYAQNYKDMVLATCIAQSNKANYAAVDAGSSASALRDWTRYDLERAPDAIAALVDDYLARDYRNPLAEPEVEGVRFDVLKCLDLYHSKALEEQVRRLVIEPQRRERRPAGRR